VSRKDSFWAMNEAYIFVDLESCSLLDDWRNQFSACKGRHSAFQNHEVSFFQVSCDRLRGRDDGAQVRDFASLLERRRNRNDVDIAILNDLGGQEVLSDRGFFENRVDFPLPDW